MGSSETGITKWSRHRKGIMRVALALTLEGPPITEEHVRAAVTALGERHPVLRSVIECVGGSGYDEQYALVPATDDTKASLRIEPAGGGEVWHAAWRAIEHQPCPLGGALAQVALIDSGATDGGRAAASRATTKTTLLLTVEHSVCDGMSISRLGHELLETVTKAASGAAPAELTMPRLEWSPSVESLARATVGGWGPIGFLKRMKLIFGMHGVMDKHPSAHFPSDETIAAADMADVCDTAFEYVTLTREETGSLFRNCKANGVTVTAAVGAAQLHAVAEIIAAANDKRDARADADGGGLQPVTTVWGADTRRWYSEKHADHHVSYHVGGISAYAMLGYGAGDGSGGDGGGDNNKGVTSTGTDALWDQAKACRAHLKKGVETRSPIGIALVMGAMYNSSAKEPSVFPHPGGFTTSVSSWGNLPFTRTYGGHWTLEGAVPVVNMSHTPFPCSLVSTAAGELTVTLLAATPVIARSDLRRLHDGILARLRWMAAHA